MKVIIFGDSNVDVTVGWKRAEKKLELLSPTKRQLIKRNIARSRREKTDIEYYLPKQDEELSRFFNSLKPRVALGGCAAIKARTMARLGHDVTLYSWVGNDKNGRLVLRELERTGVDTNHVHLSDKTCETYNLFDKSEKRLAFSFWENRLSFQEFKRDLAKNKQDMVFLAGAHRIKEPLGYSSLPGAYVFTGSFATYSKKQIVEKYRGDFSRGILVANDTEIMQLGGEEDPIAAMHSLRNGIIIMHGPNKTAVKRRDEYMYFETPPIDHNKVVEITGIGDVWESFFLGSVSDVKTASREEIMAAMESATRASMHRMLTGEFPTV